MRSAGRTRFQLTPDSASGDSVERVICTAGRCRCRCIAGVCQRRRSAAHVRRCVYPRRCRGLTEGETARAVRMADALLWESGGAVESQSLVAVGEIDDAAVGEARFLQAVAHDGVVAVGVDADVVAVAVAEVEHGIHHAVAFRQARYAVYHQIWLLVEPRSSIDVSVCGVGAGNHREYGRPLAIVFASVAHAAVDVGSHHRLVGIAAGPLPHVSAGAHYAPRRVDEFHHRVQVGRQNFAYLHKISTL